MNSLTLRVAVRYFAASLVEDLNHKMNDLLHDHPLDAGKGEALAKWLEDNFFFLSPKTPKGQKVLKGIMEKLHWWLKSGIKMHTSDEGVRATIESVWKEIEPHLDDLTKYFSSEGGKAQPKELKIDGHMFINGAGLDENKLAEYAGRLVDIFKDLKGWRKKALAGGVTVRFANPKDFAGTAGGKYKSDQDVLFVRTTPAVLKREGKGYGGFEYIITHELGHRFERKHHLPEDFDKPNWWTTPYSRNEGESFAELFALTNFDITNAHRDWGQELNDRFEKVMGGGASEKPKLPEHLRTLKSFSVSTELTALLHEVRKINVSGARSKWGDCELVADEFLAEARKRGLATNHNSYIVLGYRAYDPKFAERRRIEPKMSEHQWAVVDNVIYDGTSDQFSDSEFTVTHVGDSRYQEKSRMSHTFRRQ